MSTHEPDLWVGLLSYPGGAPMYDLDAMVTPAQAARAAGVSRQLVNDWLRRGRLARANGRVRLGDALDIEAQTRRCRRPGAYRRKPQLVMA